METKSNEFLDNLSRVIEENNSWIKCEQPMKKLGYFTFQFEISSNMMNINDPELLNQIKGQLMSSITNSVYNIFPAQYKSIYGSDNMIYTLNSYASGKKYKFLQLGHKTRETLLQNDLFKYNLKTINKGNYNLPVLFETEIISNAIFDQITKSKGTYYLLFNDQIRVNFHDMSFVQNKINISYSIILPQDHLLLENIND